jgi:dihydroorotase
MQRAGFLPDVISSDVHLFNRQGPAVDLLTTMNKAIALGVDLQSVVSMATTAAAKALRRPELGTLKVGAEGDASIFAVEETPRDLLDSLGALLVASKSLTPRGTAKAGKWREAVR